MTEPVIVVNNTPVVFEVRPATVALTVTASPVEFSPNGDVVQVVAPSSGTIVVEVPGEIGPTGAPGTPGYAAVVEDAPASAVVGQLWMEPSTGFLYVTVPDAGDNLVWVQAVGPVGAKGDQGAQGDQGLPGDVGPPGPGSAISITDTYGVTVDNVSSITVFPPLHLVDLGGGAVRIFDPAQLTPAIYSIGTYGDECNGGSVDPAWTARNCTATPTGVGYHVDLNEQGDAFTRPFVDSGQDFEIMVHLLNTTSLGHMIDLVMFDASGNGEAFSPYGDGNSYLWHHVGYNYSGTGPALGASVVSSQADYWIHLRRSTGVIKGRFYTEAAGYSAFGPSTPDSTGGNIAQIGIGRGYPGDGGPENTLIMERFIYGSPTLSL